MTLSPTSSHGGGAAFNGGTITEGLTIADPDAAENQLTITGTGDGSAKLINAVAVHTTFTVDSDGTAVLSSDDGMTLQIVGVGSGAGIGVGSNQAGTPTAAVTTTGFAYTTSGISLFKANADGLLGLYNAAPADGVLSAGQFGIWFDPTNGAAALNIKAKQADGTVKTATIPVIT